VGVSQNREGLDRRRMIAAGKRKVGGVVRGARRSNAVVEPTSTETVTHDGWMSSPRL